MESSEMAGQSKILMMEAIPKEVEVDATVSTNMVFSHVIATLSSTLVDCIPGNKDEFLSETFQLENVLVYCDLNSNTFCISGSLDEIIVCRNKLSQLLLCDKETLIDNEDCSQDGNEKVTKTFREVGINCNILGHEEDDDDVNKACKLDDVVEFKRDNSAQNPNDNTDLPIGGERFHESFSTSENNPNYEKEDLHDTNTNEKADNDEMDIDYDDEEEKISKFIVSKRGRVIKPPSKLKHSVLNFSKSEVMDESSNDNEAPPAIKIKRKVGRPRKLVSSLKAKKVKRTMIPVEEVRRIVEEEKKREREEKGLSQEVNSEFIDDSILQNLFKLNELQVQEGKIKMVSDTKALESKKHIRKYYEDRMPYKYFCDKCSFKSKRESHFQNHQSLHMKNPDLKLHTCELCDFSTVRQSVLQRHHLSHEAELIKCHLCTYTTNTNKQLEVHLKKHTKRHPSDIIPHLQCSLCNFRSLSKTRLMNHLQLHGTKSSVDGSPVFQCNECQYKTHRKEHLVRHKNNVHSNRRPYLCDLCGAAFKRIDALAAHKVTHVDKSRRKLPYNCSHCKKSFKSRAHLKEHMSVHTNLRSFQCHICGQMFKTRAVQRKHQQCIHYNPRSYKCTSCNKDFNTKYALQRHVRTHEQDALDQPQTQLQIQTKFTSGTQVQLVQDEGDFKFPQGQGQQGHDVDKSVVLPVEEQLDENISAIQTITIASENLNEFTQQLQSVSDQLRSANEIGEVYIQGLDTVDSDTINILNMPGQEVRHIFIPAGTEDSSSDVAHLEEVYVSSGTESEYVKHILITSTSEDVNVNNVSGFKEIYVQAEPGSEQMKQILIPARTRTSSSLVESNQRVLQIQHVNSQNLIEQVEGQIIEQTESEQTIEDNAGQDFDQSQSEQHLEQAGSSLIIEQTASDQIIEQVVDGQTYQIKWSRLDPNKL